jgi:hypothetical protein
VGSNAAHGAIVLYVNGKKYIAEVTGDEKFTHKLNLALKQGSDPAEALLFLAELGAKLFHPENPMLGTKDRAKWQKLFGLPKEAARKNTEHA